MSKMTLGDLAKLVDAIAQDSLNTGAPDTPKTALCRVSSIEDATPDAVVFAQNDDALRLALNSKAGAVLAALGKLETHDTRILWVRDPRYAFAVAGRALAPAPEWNANGFTGAEAPWGTIEEALAFFRGRRDALNS